MSGLRPRLSDSAWLNDEALQRILAMLDRDGEEARVVGGAVRNAMIGEPVREVDIATTAAPEEIIRRAQAAHLRAIPTGIEHGTVTLLANGIPFEVTTLREDVETYGRKARVAFGRDWQRDAERRDFTINALSASRDGAVYDYVGGLADLDARRLRFIGDPAARIAEDYLRILRFFRFHAAYGEGAPDAAALHACIEARDGLRSLSRERVRMELLKLVVARRAAEALGVMGDAGLLVTILGGVPYLSSFEKMAAIEAAVGEEPDAIRRLGALAIFVSEDADRLFERLRLSNAEHGRLFAMADGWWRNGGDIAPQTARALLYRLGAAGYADRVMLSWTRSRDVPDNERRQHLLALPARWQPPACPIAAADLMARGVAKGPALGAALRRAEAAWIAADFPSDPATIAAMADRAAGSSPPDNA
ncbi:CCA tRNA nucleotidyltransferase [Pseudorhodoplanes sp.]|uniref:CCA tRNA nucleotidyltransferase n=1 Tax=Pseudorhodoplanes sp. TaxID=1934341 RepID=UPI003D0BD65B